MSFFVLSSYIATKACTLSKVQQRRSTSSDITRVDIKFCNNKYKIPCCNIVEGCYIIKCQLV